MDGAGTRLICVPIGRALVGRIVRSPAVPILVGVVVLLAAMLKAHHAATADMPATSFLNTRWFKICTVLFELAFGLWLVSGFYQRITRWLAIGVFAGLFEISLYLHLVDAPTCGCFGRLNVLPWQAMLLDLLCIALLFAWQPGKDLETIRHRRWLLTVILAYVLVAAMVSVSMWDYAPQGPVASLRNDLRLAKPVPLRTEYATVSEVLKQLHQATGLHFSLSERFDEHQDLGRVETERAQAWAVLEWLASKQPRPARWEQTGDGYRLVPAAPLGLTFPWLVGGMILATVTVVSAVVRAQPHQTALELEHKQRWPTRDTH